jgi:flagellar biosynthesis GTPase FlhF
MKNNLWIIKFFALFLVTAFLLVSPSAEAQRKKKKKGDDTSEETTTKTSSTNDKKAKAAEDKKTRAELKKLTKNPEAYRQLKDGKAEAERQASELKSEVNRLKELEQQCAQEEEALKRQIEELMGKVQTLEKQPKGTGGFGVPAQGMYYVVQIGAFQQKDVEVNSDNPDLRKDATDGFNKYIMGVFPDIQQADQLRAFLLQLDFRRNPAYRPFIAPYKDGKRISLEEALGPEEAQKRKAQMGN